MALSTWDINTVEPEADVKIQLPSAVWSDPWADDMTIGNLDSVLSRALNLQLEPEVDSDTPTYQSSEDLQSEGNQSIGNSSKPSSASSVGHAEMVPSSPFSGSFNSFASACENPTSPFSGSFNSFASACENPTTQPVRATREKKNKKKKHQSATAPPSQNAEEKDLGHKKYKTRLCRNWQQTGRCPYGEACVYAHGTKEMRGEQENEAAVTSLTKLADQLAKQMGGFAKADASAVPLQYRKPKAIKKKPAHRPQADYGEVSRQFGCPLPHKDACMPKPHYASNVDLWWPKAVSAHPQAGLPCGSLPVTVGEMPLNPFVVAPSSSTAVQF
jgi:hypothetical protein